MRTFALLAVLLFCVSCSSVKYSTFNVSSINSGKETIRSVVIVNDEVYKTPDGQVVITPAEVRVPFEIDRNTGLFRTVKIGVRAIVEDEDGRISRGLEESDELPYYPKSRAYYHNDPYKLLFVLVRNIDF